MDPSLSTARIGAVAGSRTYLALQLAALLLLTATVITRYWHDYIWLGYVALAVTTLIWTPELVRRRFRIWWFLYVAGIFLYTLLRSHADDTFIPVRTDYAIVADRLLFLGNNPVIALQERFFDRSALTALDWLAVQLHWSFFVVPHGAAFAIFLCRRTLFPRLALAAVVTMWIGLVMFFLLPTTPPWLAGQMGDLDGVYRVMDFVGGQVDQSTYEAFYQSLAEPNSVAAMPSIHIASTAILFFWARSYMPRVAPWLLLYTVAMGAALVYLGEHYVIDLVVGFVVAWGAWRISQVAAPRIYGKQEQ